MSPTRAVLIGGRSGVGKTTVALEMHALLSANEVRHAVIEGDNLDLAHPAPWREGHALAEANLRAIWQNYRQLDYDRLIYTNTASVFPAQIEALNAALGGDVSLHAVLLTASDTEADERLARREIGGGWQEHAHRSREAAKALDRQVEGVYRVSTDGRTPTALAEEIINLSGW